MINTNSSTNLEIINRIRLLMEYSLEKTLCENLSEQTAYEFQLDRTHSDPKKAQEYNKQLRDIVNKFTKIEAPTVSELLLKAREFFFESEIGMVSEVVLSVLGAEIGAPIIFEVLNFAIICNDVLLMSQNWVQRPENSTENWFIFQYSRNKYFANVFADILVISTLGATKLVGKSAKEAYKIYQKFFGAKGVEPVINEITSNVPKIINKLPKPLQEYINKRWTQINNGFNLIKNEGASGVAKSIVKQIPQAIVMGGINYAVIKWGLPPIQKKINSWLEKKFGSSKNIDIKKIYSLKENENTIKQFIIEANPSLSPITSFQINYDSSGRNIKSFLINNNIYYMLNPNDTEGDYILKKEK